MSGIAIVSLVAYSFVSYNRGAYGSTLLAMMAASALFMVAIVLPLVAYALAAAVR
jgi:hypothetical protein